MDEGELVSKRMSFVFEERSGCVSVRVRQVATC